MVRFATAFIVVPYESEGRALATWIRRPFDGDVDVVASSVSDATWDRELVVVDRAGRIAHAVVEYARRLAGTEGRVRFATSVREEREGRAAETMCANLAGAFPGPFETRVANDSAESLMAANCSEYDLVLFGGETDRSRAARLVPPPTGDSGP